MSFSSGSCLGLSSTCRSSSVRFAVTLSGEVSSKVTVLFPPPLAYTAGARPKSRLSARSNDSALSLSPRFI